MVKSFCTHGNMLKKLNMTYSTLILKVANQNNLFIVCLLIFEIHHTKLYKKSWQIDLRKLFLILSLIKRELSQLIR